MNTIQDQTVDHGLCIGCGLCAAVCPRDAVTMHWTKHLTWLPRVDKTLCTDCGTCGRVCPNSPESIAGAMPQVAEHGVAYALTSAVGCYAVHAADDQQRLASASGGALTAVLKELLLRKEVSAVIAARPVTARAGQPHCGMAIFRNGDELDSARSSWYAPLRYDEVLREMARRNEPVAVTGVPCVLRGLDALPDRFRKWIRYRMGLVCSHNVTGQFVDFLARRQGIRPREPFVCNLRDKQGNIPDANNFNTYFRCGDRDVRVNRYQSGFTETWRSYFFAQECCLYCPDFYAAHADLSVKDAWGALSREPKGISLVIVRNPELRAVVDDMLSRGVLGGESVEKTVVAESQPATAFFKHVEIWHRQFWKTPLRVLLKKQGYGGKFRRCWVSTASQNYWNYRLNLAVTCWTYSRSGTVPKRLLAAVGSWGSSARGLLRMARAVGRRCVDSVRARWADWRGRIHRPGSVRQVRRGSRRVLIAGGYGYRNTGDEAQLAANLMRWNQADPQAEIIVLSPDPAYTQSTHRVNSLPATRVVFFEMDKRNDYSLSNDVFKQDFRRLKPRLLWNARLLRWGLPLVGISPSHAAFLGLLQSADVLHLCGGGYLTGKTLSRLWDHLLLIRLAHALNVPVILSGQTIGVFQDEESRGLAIWGLKKARLIYLRDREHSRKDLEDVGIAGSRVQETFDDALICPQAGPDEVKKSLEALGIDPHRPYVAANVHDWGLGPDERNPVIARFAEICDWLVREQGMQIVMAPMAPCDAPVERECLGLMREKAVLLEYDYDYRIVRGVIGAARLCFTMKHHPIVFSIANHTPVVSVTTEEYYYHKNAGALGLCGLDAFVLKKEEFFSRVVFDKIAEALTQHDELAAKMHSWMDENQSRAGETIERFLGGSSAGKGT